MVDLQKRQEQLWKLLQMAGNRAPMLRMSREDDCFWICDLPRHCDEATCQAIAIQLGNEGFSVCLDAKASLWRIDLSMCDSLFESWVTPLPLPNNEALHPAYALYRLLAAHPADIARQPMPLLRSILKQTLPTQQDSKQLQRLHMQCAALLNRRQPLPSAACKALAQFILKEELS